MPTKKKTSKPGASLVSHADFLMILNVIGKEAGAIRSALAMCDRIDEMLQKPARSVRIQGFELRS